MIDNIIEESYHKKVRPIKKISSEESEKGEVFNKVINQNFEGSLIKNKVRNADATINSNIDNLLSFSLIDSKNRKVREQVSKLRFSMFASEPVNKTNKIKKKHTRHIFKSDFTLSEQMKKTKTKEFSFFNKTKKIISEYSTISKINSINNKNYNIQKYLNLNQNKGMFNTIFRPESAKVESVKKKQNLSMNNDSLFITKLPQSDYFPNKTNVLLSKLNSRVKSKDENLRKMRKIIKESNSQMLDIYTGLKNLKQNKFTTFNGVMSSSYPKSKKIDIGKLKSERNLRNVDNFISLQFDRSRNVAYINRKFKTLFQKIFRNKQFSNEKLDARRIMDPLEEIIKGGYREIRLDNTINQTLGQRIWIKKTTANIVSYGKSCSKISDDIFYKERKRIIGIYPKIEEAAKLIYPKRKIDKRNPMLKKLVNNIDKINDIFLEEYNLLKRVNKKWKKLQSENKL